VCQVSKLGGREDATYCAALKYIQQKSRIEGIDAALQYQPDPSKPAIELDALLIPDRNYQGQQLSAQAGYPIVCVPIGVDDKGGRPYGLSLHQKAFQERKLIKYASAIEDLLGGAAVRARPQYREHTATNVPVIA
jgi:amidase